MFSFPYLRSESISVTSSSVLIQDNKACLLNRVVYVAFKTFCNSNYDESVAHKLYNTSVNFSGVF